MIIFGIINSEWVNVGLVNKELKGVLKELGTQKLNMLHKRKESLIRASSNKENYIIRVLKNSGYRTDFFKAQKINSNLQIPEHTCL